jgi:hypothetical protein
LIKRASIVMTVLALVVLTVLSGAACGTAAGTYVSNQETTKDENGTTKLDWVLKLEPSGKYTLTQLMTDEWTNGDGPPPYEMAIDEGTWTLDGDRVILKPTSVAELPDKLSRLLGDDPKKERVGTLSGDVISFGDSEKYVRQ